MRISVIGVMWGIRFGYSEIAFVSILRTIVIRCVFSCAEYLGL